MLTVKTERAGDVVVVKCAGRIVRGQEPALRNAVLAEKLARIVVLDLSDVESLDAGGLTLLVALHRWTDRRKASVDKVAAEVSALVDSGTPSVSAIGVAAGLITDLAERG